MRAGSYAARATPRVAPTSSSTKGGWSHSQTPGVVPQGHLNRLTRLIPGPLERVVAHLARVHDGGPARRADEDLPAAVVLPLPPHGIAGRIADRQEVVPRIGFYHDRAGEPASTGR